MVITLILQMKKLKQERLKQPSPGYTARRRWSRDLNPSILAWLDSQQLAITLLRTSFVLGVCSALFLNIPGEVGSVFSFFSLFVDARISAKGYKDPRLRR